jgi:hypothetical protein
MREKEKDANGTIAITTPSPQCLSVAVVRSIRQPALLDVGRATTESAAL